VRLYQPTRPLPRVHKLCYFALTFTSGVDNLVCLVHLVYLGCFLVRPGEGGKYGW